MTFDPIIGWADVVIAAVAVIVSFQLHRLIAKIKDDFWLREMGKVHCEFWGREGCAEVRSWIACDDSYAKIEDILKRRRKDLEESHHTTRSVNPADYEVLDKFDRFFNLMLRIKRLAPKKRAHEQAYKELFLQYWLDHAFRRPEIAPYMEKFYPSLVNECHASLARNPETQDAFIDMKQKPLPAR